MRLIALAFAATVLVSCSHPAQKAPPADGRIHVETTFSTLNSFVTAVGGDHVVVSNLVPVGASPEEYQPTPQDVATLADAQIAVVNGAGIDGWVERIIRSSGNAQLRVVTCTDGLTVVGGNPHLWMDPQLAKHYVDTIQIALSQLDPAHAAEYVANAHAYDAKLDALTTSIATQIATIPQQQRLMIVYHDAWPYYARQFGLQIVGAIVPGPGQEPNPGDLARLVALARTRNVRAIFAEPEYSAKLAHSIASDAHIAIVSNLYDDSIGTDPRVHDYLSMLQYDTDVIVKALR